MEQKALVKRLINTKISPDVYDWAKSSAAADRRTISSFIFLILEDQMLADRRRNENAKA